MERISAYLPKDWTGQILSIVLIVFQVLHYIWRTKQDEFIMDAGLGLFFLCMGLAPFILLGLLLVLATVGATFVYSFSSTGHPLPVFILFVGGIFSLTAPLPPSPAQNAFYRYQSEYEAVVELARQHQLAHEGYCGYAFSLPEAYAHLTQECVFVEYEPELAVLFSPPTSHRVIVYVETKDALEEIENCNGEDGSVFTQLEDNWFLCTPAQD
ncbi:MAG TPA: hypothetical protein VIO36_02460 [Anaerolineaceae bacterium]